MVKIPTRAAIILVVLITVCKPGESQTVYNITSNQNWAAGYYCGNCQFNISPGVTLTLNTAWATCLSCTFTGGNINIVQPFMCLGCTVTNDALTVNNTVSFLTSGSFSGGKLIINQATTCQGCSFNSDSVFISSAALTLQSSLSTFSGSVVAGTGSATLNGNAPISITNSTMSFTGTSGFLNSGGALSLSASSLLFYGNSNFQATAGPVTLASSSSIIAGDGTLASAAYLNFNGPALTIKDNSVVAVANKNNYYFNWNSYSTSTSSYSTSINTINCGGTNPHACAAPYVYGCATLNAVGPVACTILALSTEDFNASQETNGSVLLTWNTQQETNSNRFVVERSSNGLDWNAIGTVDAAGNSSTEKEYTYTDNDPVNGISYYRLQIVDNSNNIDYSKIVSINRSALTNNESGIYPNPVVNQTFNIKTSLTDPCVLNVYSFSGQLLFSTSLQGQLVYTVKLPKNTVSSPSLVIQLISKGITQAFTVLNK